MPTNPPEVQEVTTVLIGDFNPAIFQPAWFAAHGLIREQEAQSADIKVIHHEITQFSLEWVTLTVTGDRFVAASSVDSPFEVVRDLVLGCFDLLMHTPIKFMGINRNMHFRLTSIDQMNELGFTLVPQAPWAQFFEDPRVSALVVQDARAEPPGFRQVQLAPSRLIAPAPGVHLAANNHFEIANGAPEAMELLRSNWQQAITWPLSILDSLLEALP